MVDVKIGLILLLAVAYVSAGGRCLKTCYCMISKKHGGEFVNCFEAFTKPDKTKIPADISPNTETLLFNDNRLELTADTFVGLTKLKHLRLERNQLESIPAGAFAPLSNMETLSLYNNQLTSLDADTFNSMTNLRELRISANKLTALDPLLLKPLVNLRKLSLLSNPLQCCKVVAALKAAPRWPSYLRGYCKSPQGTSVYLKRLRHMKLVGC